MSEEPHQYNLKWRNHRKNFFQELENLFKTDLLTDINLILEGGRVVPCHKMVLATTSLAFRDFLLKNPEALDMIIPGVTYHQMRTLLEYMYSGQAQIMYTELSSLLKVAELLKIKGLTRENEEDRSSSPTSSHQEQTPIQEEPPNSPPPTISTSTNDHTENKPAESSVASPPPPAHSTADFYDFYKYSTAYNMPAFPSLTPFPIPQYAAAMAAAASEYYGSMALDKLKDTPILRNVLHQHNRDESLTNTALINGDRNGPVASHVSSLSDEEKRQMDDKPRNSPYYKVKKELMERVQQQQQQQCQSTEASSTPSKSGKQKVDWKRYKQYSPDDLNRAINAVIVGEMSALKASQIFSVPSRTLYDKIKRLKNARAQNGESMNEVMLSENDSACFPYGVGRNVNGRIYKRNRFSPRSFPSLLTPENLSMMNNDNCVGPSNMNASVCSDAMSSSSNSPPAWQQMTTSEDEPPRYNLSPAHSALSRQSTSDCEMAEDLSVKKSTAPTKIKEEINDDISE